MLAHVASCAPDIQYIRQTNVITQQAMARARCSRVPDLSQQPPRNPTTTRGAARPGHPPSCSSTVRGQSQVALWPIRSLVTVGIMTMFLQIRKADGYNYRTKPMCTHTRLQALAPGPWSCPWPQAVESNQTNAVSVSIKPPMSSAQTRRENTADTPGRPGQSILACRGLANRSSLQDIGEDSGLSCLGRPASV